MAAIAVYRSAVGLDGSDFGRKYVMYLYFGVSIKTRQLKGRGVGRGRKIFSVSTQYYFCQGHYPLLNL